MEQLVIISDFDGTLIEIDSVRYILETYVDGDWKAPDDLYNEGLISLEECLRQQVSMIRLTKERIIEALDGIIKPRRYFDEFLGYCRRNIIPFSIASAGFDFYIRHFLSRRGLDKMIEFVAPETIFTDEGLKLEFPDREDLSTVNFKEDIVRRFQKEGKKVAYLGNGTSDLEAIMVADIPLVVRDSKLSRHCARKHIRRMEFEDFGEVLDILKDPERFPLYSE